MRRIVSVDSCILDKIQTDSFSPDEVISPDDLAGFLGEDTQSETEGPVSIDTLVVRMALAEMAYRERYILISYCIKGKAMDDIAGDLAIGMPLAYSLKTKGVSHFKELVAKKRVEFGMTLDFHQCPICDSPRVRDINEFIHVWLDANGWNFNGILKRLKDEYGIEGISSLSQIATHVNLHLQHTPDSVDSLISTDKNTPTGKTELPKGKRQTSAMSLSLPDHLKHEIEAMSVESGLSQSDIVRQSVELGLVMLRHELELCRYMERSTLRLNRLLRNFNE
jgi:hypothetical protein